MPMKVKGWVVTLRKYASTWHYFTQNPQGGGFGSNAVDSKKAVLARALRGIPSGELVTVITKHREKVISVETIRR